MTLDYFLYHKLNTEKNLPQEDYYIENDNIFIVADGIRHDPNEKGDYPTPSESYEIAVIACNTCLSHLQNSDRKTNAIKEAFAIATKKIVEYQKNSNLYKNRETNAYTIGATRIIVGIISPGKITYGLIDDCFFSIFSEDLIDHPMLIPNVENTSKYFDAHYDWSLPEHRKYFRKELRNNTVEVDKKLYGFGSLDGRSGYERFAQYGEESLKDGDLVCIYSAGFIKPLLDTKLAGKLRNEEFSKNVVDAYCKEKGFHREKTAYFIKYNE